MTQPEHNPSIDEAKRALLEQQAIKLVRLNKLAERELLEGPLVVKKLLRLRKDLLREFGQKSEIWQRNFITESIEDLIKELTTWKS
jgi:hypothetical protein